MDLAYIYSLFSRAVEKLCIGEGDARARVKDACRIIVAVPASEMPPELRDDFNWIVSKLSSKPALIIGGAIVKPSIDCSVDRMKNKTAAAIASRVLTLEMKLADRLPDLNDFHSREL